MIEFKNNYLNERIKDVILREKDKNIQITYGGNLDLYINIFGYGETIQDEHFVEKIEFLIKNEDEAWIYFNRLVNGILKDEKNNERVGLFKNNVIKWYSDETYLEGANMLSIQKENEGIRLAFFDNPNDSNFGIPIRICNSGSRYDPFNVNFMKLYNEFQDLYKTKNNKTKEDEER